MVFTVNKIILKVKSLLSSKLSAFTFQNIQTVIILLVKHPVNLIVVFLYSAK